MVVLLSGAKKFALGTGPRDVRSASMKGGILHFVPNDRQAQLRTRALIRHAGRNEPRHVRLLLEVRDELGDAVELVLRPVDLGEPGREVL